MPEPEGPVLDGERDALERLERNLALAGVVGLGDVLDFDHRILLDRESLASGSESATANSSGSSTCREEARGGRGGGLGRGGGVRLGHHLIAFVEARSNFREIVIGKPCLDRLPSRC